MLTALVNVHVKCKLRNSLETLYISTRQFPELIKVLLGDATNQIPYSNLTF